MEAVQCAQRSAPGQEQGRRDRRGRVLPVRQPDELRRGTCGGNTGGNEVGTNRARPCPRVSARVTSEVSSVQAIPGGNRIAAGRATSYGTEGPRRSTGSWCPTIRGTPAEHGHAESPQSALNCATGARLKCLQIDAFAH